MNLEGWSVVGGLKNVQGGWTRNLFQLSTVSFLNWFQGCETGGSIYLYIYIEAATQKALRMNIFRIGSLRQLIYWSSGSLWLLARGANAFETCSVSAPEIFWDVGWMW